MQFMPNSPNPPKGIIFSFLVCIVIFDAITAAARSYHTIRPLPLESALSTPFFRLSAAAKKIAGQNRLFLPVPPRGGYSKNRVAVPGSVALEWPFPQEKAHPSAFSKGAFILFCSGRLVDCSGPLRWDFFVPALAAKTKGAARVGHPKGLSIGAGSTK
jgi:hypothetical protein